MCSGSESGDAARENTKNRMWFGWGTWFDPLVWHGPVESWDGTVAQWRWPKQLCNLGTVLPWLVVSFLMFNHTGGWLYNWLAHFLGGMGQLTNQYLLYWKALVRNKSQLCLCIAATYWENRVNQHRTTMVMEAANIASRMLRSCLVLCQGMTCIKYKENGWGIGLLYATSRRGVKQMGQPTGRKTPGTNALWCLVSQSCKKQEPILVMEEIKRTIQVAIPFEWWRGPVVRATDWFASSGVHLLVAFGCTGNLRWVENLRGLQPETSMFKGFESFWGWLEGDGYHSEGRLWWCHGVVNCQDTAGIPQLSQYLAKERSSSLRKQRNALEKASVGGRWSSNWWTGRFDRWRLAGGRIHQL